MVWAPHIVAWLEAAGIHEVLADVHVHNACTSTCAHARACPYLACASARLSGMAAVVDIFLAAPPVAAPLPVNRLLDAEVQNILALLEAWPNVWEYTNTDARCSHN